MRVVLDLPKKRVLSTIRRENKERSDVDLEDIPSILETRVTKKKSRSNKGSGVLGSEGGYVGGRAKRWPKGTN